MPSDPWLTDDGELHPAAEPLPEWKEGGLTHRLRFLSELACWRIEHCDPGAAVWYLVRETTPHEAAALLEKDKREKLWVEHRIALCPDTFGGLRRWHVFKYGANGMSHWLGEDGKWYLKSDAKMNVARFWSTDFTVALQAGALATKGDDNGKG